MKSAVIIPARLESSRLHQKMLQTIGAIPIIAHTAERCLESNVHKVFVATDSQLIAQAVKHLNVTPVLTPTNLATGSDRVAYVANTVATAFDVIINVQGDEPFLDPKIINMLVDDFQKQFDNNKHTHYVNTACEAFINKQANKHDDEHDELQANATVKVVKDMNNYALYFSRSVVPFVRNNNTNNSEKHNHYKHLGIYGFHKNFLMKFTQMTRTPLEIAESLEQLRLLEHGHKIKVLEITTNTDVHTSLSLSIDTPEDLEQAEKLFAKMKTRKQ